MKKKDIFQKTRRSVIITSTGIVFFCLLIFSILTITLYSSRVFSSVDNTLIQEKLKAQKLLTTNLHMENKVWKNKNLMPPIPPNVITIEYVDGKVYGMNRNPYFDEENLPNLTDESTKKIEEIDSGGYKFRGVSVYSGNIKVEFLINIDPEIDSINRLVRTVIFALVILIGIAIILSRILASKLIKPIKEAYDKQVFFVQDASHEMKTPLAVIKGKLELLANSWGDKIEDHFEYISKMMSEVRGLEKLNSDLLLLSKEDIYSDENISEFDLEVLINDISEVYLDLSEIQNKEFNIIKPKRKISVKWDYEKVKGMLIILIENAFKYTENGGKIELFVEDFNKNIKVEVKDNGIGIKEEDQNRVFDRFFRSSDVRGKNISGSGIGLSLLKSISNTLGIDVKLYSEYGVGTKFQLILPKIME